MNAIKLTQFNQLSRNEAVDLLSKCCGSNRWANQMELLRPFTDLKSLMERGSSMWNQLSEMDWKEAFAHHPKIGDIESLKKKFASTRGWAEQEQSGSQNASMAVLQALALANQTYENRFGYIFIVCATGKSAEEMLKILESRLNHDPKTEIKIAAQEQDKITKIRLEKLIYE